MTSLVLNRRLNKRNIQLHDDTQNETVGYDLGNGNSRFVPWLGFIDRHSAKQLPGARPVRLVRISRVGYKDSVNTVWRDLDESRECVHGCLTDEGCYAVFDATVATVVPKSVESSGS